MKKQTILIQLSLVLAILVVANLVSNGLYLRLDFTEDQRYTLSEATEDILEDLDEVVTITAYFSADMPPQLMNNRKDFEDMLIEYENRSGGDVVYQFENPNEDELTEQEAQQKGIVPLSVNMRENDRVETLRAYMGAELQMGDRTEVLPVVQPGAAMEYDLTSAIKKLSIIDKPKIGVIQGHGELPLTNLIQLQQQLSVLYDVEEYTIGLEDVPTYYRGLLWVAPADTIPPSHFSVLDRYLQNGGTLLLAYANVQGDLQQALLSTAPDIGLTRWLEDNGIVLGTDFVIDVQCATIGVQRQQGFFTINSQLEFPYFPSISNFADHPLTQGLDQITFDFTTSVTALAGTDAQITPLVFTSEQSGTVTAPTYIDIDKRWTENDFVMSTQSLAVAVEGAGNGAGKMVVIGNGEFFNNGSGQQQSRVQDDHINLVSNGIDWMVDDTGLIDLRTKGVTSRPLEQVEDGEKSMYKYGNVFAPILILLIYGFVRRLQGQRKVQKWREGNYD